MSIREKIYTYYFYNYARMDYNLIAETENEEKIYYNPEYGKIVVFVEDKELGKKCYDTVKDLCRNKVKIQNLQDNEWDFVITKFYEKEKSITVIFAEIRSYTKNFKFRLFTQYYTTGDKAQKLLQTMQFIMAINNKGYSINTEEFDEKQCNTMSRFLSYFKKEELDKDTVNTLKSMVTTSKNATIETAEDIKYARKHNECIIKLMHYELEQIREIKEFYDIILSKNAVIEEKNLPYTINIARFTYFYYKICEEGKEYSDKDLYEYLNNSKEKCEFEEAYSLLIEAELYQSIKQEVYKSYINVYLTDKITSIEDLLKTYNITEETEEYYVFENKYKIYKEELPKEIAYCIPKNSDIMLEKIEKKLKKFNGKVIGYEFKKTENKRITEISKTNFDNASKIFMFTINMNRALGEIKEDEKCDGNFDVDQIIKVDETYKPVVTGIKEYYAIYKTKLETRKYIMATIFYKTYKELLTRKYGIIKDGKELLKKEELKYLSPNLATQIILYYGSGNEEIMLSQEDALEEFLENSKSTQKGTNSIYYNRSMESLIEYPFVFNYELESKIGKLVKGTKIKLDNYKDAIIFKRAITVEEMNKKILNMKTLQNFGDEKITVTKLLEIIYSAKTKREDSCYLIAGIIVTKIEGQKLSDQILKLNNKELFEVTSNILCKFEGYKIPLDAIYMKTPNEFYINALECKLETTRKSIAEYIKKLFQKMESLGYNPNAFYELEIENDLEPEEIKEYFAKLAKNMNSYCKEHQIYYESSKKCCPICQKTKYVFPENEIENYEIIFEDEYATHYKVPQKDYAVKVYKKELTEQEKEALKENIEDIIKKDLAEKGIFYQTYCIPLKTAYSGSTFVGYIYNSEGLSKQNIIDLKNPQIVNVVRIKALTQLIQQIINIRSWNNCYLEKNAFTKVFLVKGHTDQVQVVNPEFWNFRIRINTQQTDEYVFQYIKEVINSDPKINLPIEREKGRKINLNTVQNLLEYYIQTNKNYCKTHKMYYKTDSLFCPECLKKIKGIRKSKESLEDTLKMYKKEIGHGGEADVYEYEGEKVLKVFKPQIDINSKIVVISRILSKESILKEENQKNTKYHYVLPEEIILGEKSFGYTMEKVDGMDILYLRDKSVIKDLNFTRKDILEILISMGEGIEALHKKADIFIGDLNGGNVLFDKNKKVYFLDFDGMGIDEIVPEYLTTSFVDPRFQKNNKFGKENDWYSFAIQAFYYLTHVHPFKGRYIVKVNGEEKDMDMKTRKEQKISLLGNHGIKIPDIAEPWNWMQKELQEKFLAIFEGDDRESIVPLLKEQYKILYGSSNDIIQKIIGLNKKSNSGEIIQINPKFVAEKIEKNEERKFENLTHSIDEKGNETFSNNSRTLTVQKLFDEFLIKLDGNLYCSIKNENALNNTSIKVFYSEKTKNWCVLTSEGNGALIIPSKGSIKISLEKQINLESVAFYNDRLYIPEDKKLVILEIITKITKQMECNLITADSKIFDVNKQGFFVNTETNIYNVHQI